MRRLTCEGHHTGQRRASLPSHIRARPASFAPACRPRLAHAACWPPPYPPLRAPCDWRGLDKMHKKLTTLIGVADTDGRKTRRAAWQSAGDALNAFCGPPREIVRM